MGRGTSFTIKHCGVKWFFKLVRSSFLFNSQWQIKSFKYRLRRRPLGATMRALYLTFFAPQLDHSFVFVRSHTNPELLSWTWASDCHLFNVRPGAIDFLFHSIGMDIRIVQIHLNQIGQRTMTTHWSYNNNMLSSAFLSKNHKKIDFIM